jgi:hypothetical protein
MKWLWRQWHLEGQGFRPRELPNTDDTTFFWEQLFKNIHKRVEEEKIEYMARKLNWGNVHNPKFLDQTHSKTKDP